MRLVRKRKIRSGNGEVGRHPFSQDVRYEEREEKKISLIWQKYAWERKEKIMFVKWLFYLDDTIPLIISPTYERLKLECFEGFEIPLVIRSSFLSYQTTMNIKILSQIHPPLSFLPFFSPNKLNYHCRISSVPNNYQTTIHTKILSQVPPPLSCPSIFLSYQTQVSLQNTIGHRWLLPESWYDTIRTFLAFQIRWY